jgi:hypothetical protein
VLDHRICVVPIRPLLEAESGVFQPHGIASITNAFEAALGSLGLADRNDPAVMAGIAAIACSMLFLTVVLTAMLLLPVGVG